MYYSDLFIEFDQTGWDKKNDCPHYDWHLSWRVKL